MAIRTKKEVPMTNKENLQYTSLIRALYILGHDDVADKILNSDEEEIKRTLEELKKKHAK